MTRPDLTTTSGLHRPHRTGRDWTDLTGLDKPKFPPFFVVMLCLVSGCFVYLYEYFSKEYQKFTVKKVSKQILDRAPDLD